MIIEESRRGHLCGCIVICEGFDLEKWGGTRHGRHDCEVCLGRIATSLYDNAWNPDLEVDADPN
jgi:hypothetical protein